MSKYDNGDVTVSEGNVDNDKTVENDTDNRVGRYLNY